MSRALWDVVTSVLVTLTGVTSVLLLLLHLVRRELSPSTPARSELLWGLALAAQFASVVVVRFVALGT